MEHWEPRPDEEAIEIIGAREHNLQNVSLSIPREKLVVITGVSGSGKSSLAFDTLYSEGQRRYMETFSAYIRQFIGGIERPDVDKINGLSPVIAIDQKTTSRNPRSTVGTITEIYDFLRLLFARVGVAYSHQTGRLMESLTDSEILQRIQHNFEGKKIILLSPIIKGRKGHYREDLEKIRNHGYTRARIDGEVVEILPEMQLDRYKIHDIEAVVDRMEVNAKNLPRLTQSVTTALDYGKGSMQVLDLETNEAHWFTRFLMDPETGLSYDEPAPNSFSFNSPYGWCPTCTGLGEVLVADEKAIVPNATLNLNSGALDPIESFPDDKDLLLKALKSWAKELDVKLTEPFENLSEEVRHKLLHGLLPPDAPLPKLTYGWENYLKLKTFGLVGFIQLVFMNSASEQMRLWAEQYLRYDLCPECGGARLKKESLHFRLDDKNIFNLSSMGVDELTNWFDGVEQRLDARQNLIAVELLKEIRKRLAFLLDVGLDYLALNRPARTLSGGEAQRIRLATQIGSQLVGVLYILDEPSIGLHQRDNDKLIQSLKNLRDLGNSVVVVEHDKDMMLAADHLVEIGPGAGVHGGKIVAQGTPEQFMQYSCATADYLSDRRAIAVPEIRRQPGERWLRLKGATGNNLQNVTLNLPLGTLICITGVSGSGKSTLITSTLYPVLHQHSFDFRKPCQPFESIEGLEHLDKVIEIDQKPIGRTPRSNSATYTGLFSLIRDLFTELPESKIRGYKPGRFSFNVKGGRCENCRGAGVQVIEMNFLPDVHASCDVCRGRRYNRETLEVCYKGKSINDVLNMTVSFALEFFAPVPRIKQKLQALEDVGLGYLQIGQPATTLSGGEAQRMKIATELSKKDTGRTFYILDEPTTGLHFQDIEQLLKVLNRLVEKGNTVLVIEHNLDVVKVADWVVDLGPEGGRGGGRIIAEGTPETIAQCEESHTGRFLKKELSLSPQLV